MLTFLPGEGAFVDFDVNVPFSAKECVVDEVTVTADSGGPVASENVFTSASEYVFEVRPQVDFDVDGTVDRCDLCPDLADPDQPDADNDGLGDGCDLCPNTFDPGQLDEVFDSVGDACAQGSIPTVSHWGLVAMTLLVLTAGTLVLAHRRRVTRPISTSDSG